MLRRLDESTDDPLPIASLQTTLPTGAEPFLVEERPFGIRFYQGRSSFFQPYALLQAMSFSEETVKLLFANVEVVVEGRGLHEAYVLLAGQRVAALVEQGHRYSAVSTAPTHISRIERIQRVRKKKPEADQTPSPETESEADE